VHQVLVTGATGFAGSHLVDLLSQSGAQVTGWRRNVRQSDAETTKVRWQTIDVLDRNAVATAIAELRPSTVFHCAGSAHVARSWSHSTETLATNVLGTHHLLDAVRRSGLNTRVLIPGSAYVYHPFDRPLDEADEIAPASPYAVSKLAQELLGRHAWQDDGQQVYVTRSFNQIGPGQDETFAASAFARQIAAIERRSAEPIIRVGNLDAVRDLTDVRDTVRAYRDIVERGRPGILYNVCSGTGYRIRDVLDGLLRLSRVPVEVEVDPTLYRPNDLPVLVGNPSLLQQDTGWTPSISLGKTLEDLLNYWRKEV